MERKCETPAGAAGQVRPRRCSLRGGSPPALRKASIGAQINHIALLGD
ncbi:hypothetical protein [Peribacillus muralis]